ncbi:MAG: prenyltransferase/squalene oxidase repeat-containing protein [Phycisphaerae bacterium]|nr:prenyltransferase/squalene oxidase repeat-containing protein [Phycisphaerae bacterium]
MLQAASLALNLLNDSAGLVIHFTRRRRNADGGFRGRSAESDLYYTVFGTESLIALQADFPLDLAVEFLQGFGGGESLDFIHLACLARCWADLPGGRLSEPARAEILQHIERHRSRDGGYGLAAGAEHGGAYACFLALGAHQDLEADVPEESGLADCLAHLEVGGGYANERGIGVGTTPTTAAAVCLFHHLGREVPAPATDWLLARRHPEGGFLATPDAPIPDLLSTATALHALALAGVALDELREPCLDFLDSLWNPRGGFQGSWADDTLDCEYTFYGLLALGRLSA